MGKTHERVSGLRSSDFFLSGAAAKGKGPDVRSVWFGLNEEFIRCQRDSL